MDDTERDAQFAMLFDRTTALIVAVTALSNALNRANPGATGNVAEEMYRFAQMSNGRGKPKLATMVADVADALMGGK